MLNKRTRDGSSSASSASYESSPKKVATYQELPLPTASSNSMEEFEDEVFQQQLADEFEEQNKLTVETVINDDGIYEVARTPISNQTEKIVELEGIENDPAHPNVFNATKYVDKKIVVLDIGSSLIKGSEFILPKKVTNKNKIVKEKILKFQGEQFLNNINHFNSETKQLELGEFDMDSRWEKLENLKKIFMVSEFEEITLKSKEKVRVALLIYKMVEELFKKMVTTEANGKPVYENVGGIIVTCPTGTSEFTKSIFRRCIWRAFLAVFSDDSIKIEDVFVIEEYVLLKHFAEFKGTSAYVDLGHLTLDLVLIEERDGESIVTFKNGEAGGMSLVQDVIKKLNLDPIKEMKEIFDNPDNEKLPKNLQPGEGEIIKAVDKIVKPLRLMILQKQIQNIHFSGAITKVKFFTHILQELLSEECLRKTKIELQPYLKKEFEKVGIPKCQFKSEVTGASALVSGAEMILNQSLAQFADGKSPNVPIIFKEYLEENQYIPGILYLCDNDEFRIELKLMGITMEVKQDTEIFLIKFNPMIDTKKIKSIGIDNFNKVGILEFIRFSTMVICFDETIKTSNLNFILKLDLENDFLTATFFYTRHRYYYTFIKLERKGRNERISINDAQVIFQKNEEVKAWFGMVYESLCIVHSSNSRETKPALVKKIIGRNHTNTIQPKKVGKEVQKTTIPASREEDLLFVKTNLTYAQFVLDIQLQHLDMPLQSIH